VQAWEHEKSKLLRSVETAQDKLSLVKDNKDREIKDLNRKITDISGKLKMQMTKTTEVERKLSIERETYL